MPRTHLALFVFTAFLALTLCPVAAWGPHGEITQAALDVLGPDDALVQKLEGDAPRLTQYVWMADQRQQLIVRKDEVFYADDYLLFPGAERHLDHLCPEVKEAYRPYFRRALLALKSETPRNAARWVGALLHFVTDTGSPPHSAEIRGEVHSKMENWVDAKLIHIPGYQPQSLGATDAAAEDGLVERMEGLISYCKERANRCRADVEAGRRPLVEPVVLEAALETARVTADLLHTLGTLVGGYRPDHGGLGGRIEMPAVGHDVLCRLPAKVVVLGTTYSTLTADSGVFSLQGLSPGPYRLVAVAPGRISPVREVVVRPGMSSLVQGLSLCCEEGDEGNLVRNCCFSLQWLAADALDAWSRAKRPGRLQPATPVREWNGEWIPLKDGQTYALSARWKPGAGAEVIVRTKGKSDPNGLATESPPVTAVSPVQHITGSAEVRWAQLCIRGQGPPGEMLERVSLRAEVADATSR